VVAKDTPFDTFPYHRNTSLYLTLAAIFYLFIETAWERVGKSIRPPMSIPTLPNWHFYCVTYTYGSASSCTLYVDGAEVAGTLDFRRRHGCPGGDARWTDLDRLDGTGTPSYGSTYRG